MNVNGAGMIFTALLFLVIPGLIYNNMNSSGLVNTSLSMTCSSDPGQPTCHLSANVGCQVAPANCALSGSAVSFLNGASPFTQVIQGNVFALFTNLNGPSYSGPGAQNTIAGSHGPFDVAQGGSFVQANCLVTQNSGTDQKHWGIHSCTQTYSDNKNTSLADASRWNNWNTQQSGASLTTPFHNITGNATAPNYSFSCNFLAQINYTAVNNGPGFTYYGCDLDKGSGTGVITNPTWSFLVSIPVQYPALGAGSTHQFIYAQLENWDTLDCAAAQSVAANQPFNSASCQAFMNSFKGIALPGCGLASGSSCVSFVPGGGGPVVAFLLGLVLVVGGLGLQIGIAAGLSIGINPQGTKLLQVIGIGLIVYSFLVSEFATWYSSGLLPYGLDGVFGIINMVITGTLFSGFYLLTQTGSATTSG